MPLKEGDVFEQKYLLTDAVYNGYIQIFDDKNPLHTDQAFATARGFEAEVMHGGILTGFLSNFVGERLPLKNVIIQQYKIAFTKPVYLNSILFFKATVTGFYESVNCIIFKFEFKNELHLVAKGELTIGLI